MILKIAAKAKTNKAACYFLAFDWPFLAHPLIPFTRRCQFLASLFTY
jgi:hypothetical protein